MRPGVANGRVARMRSSDLRMRSDQGCALADRVPADDVDLAREEAAGHARGETRADEVPSDRIANDEDEAARVAWVSGCDVNPGLLTQ